MAAFALLVLAAMISLFMFGEDLPTHIVPPGVAVIAALKGYFVLAALVPEEALGPAFTTWPEATLPVFVAMMFAGTLGGNATLIGASANIVSAGICAAQGRPVGFAAFMRYGVPMTLCQPAVAAVYVGVMFALYK
jgi:Na+/H+ antiporter NhaD/arsenite permease-like protein